MAKRATTAEQEQKNNRRVLRIAGALAIAGALILGAVYIPDIFEEKEEFVDYEISRTFVGTIEDINYEEKTLTFALDTNELLYPTLEDEGSTAPTDREKEISIWTISARVDDNPVTPDTEVYTVRADIEDESNPRVLREPRPFSSLERGDFVQVHFWQREISLAQKTILPFYIYIVQNPYDLE